MRPWLGKQKPMGIPSKTRFTDRYYMILRGFKLCIGYYATESCKQIYRKLLSKNMSRRKGNKNTHGKPCIIILPHMQEWKNLVEIHWSAIPWERLLLILPEWLTHSLALLSTFMLFPAVSSIWAECANLAQFTYQPRVLPSAPKMGKNKCPIPCSYHSIFPLPQEQLI